MKNKIKETIKNNDMATTTNAALKNNIISINISINNNNSIIFFILSLSFLSSCVVLSFSFSYHRLLLFLICFFIFSLDFLFSIAFIFYCHLLISCCIQYCFGCILYFLCHLYLYFSIIHCINHFNYLFSMVLKLNYCFKLLNYSIISLLLKYFSITNIIMFKTIIKLNTSILKSLQINITDLLLNIPFKEKNSLLDIKLKKSSLTINKITIDNLFILLDFFLLDDHSILIKNIEIEIFICKNRTKELLQKMYFKNKVNKTEIIYDENN